MPVVVPIAGKQVPLTAKWLNKTIASVNFGPFEGQISADYIGRRPVTYLDDLYVKSTFQLGLEASYRFDVAQAPWLKAPRVSVNVTNLNDDRGVSTAVVTGASGGYAAYPLSPRQVFVTLQVSF